ncbi:DNA-binding protein [Achromobacter sp. RTa]|uniref:helix-turn-helix domain-containing protein n=1 Tax=Achromobacter sp. RTa TaxID=1532557 RepID=UPI00050E3260|nr:helix-turn-helix transcriptional regulator [Achromobacter sp. RTa]KGD93340.1 DNA-binding protein [Achromobacter sp. RTa]
MSLAQRLHTLMRWRGIKSQNQLARISGASQSCIHRILTRNDRYEPSRATLLRLARALDTSVPWLTDGVAPGPGSTCNGACQHNEADDPYDTEIRALLRQHSESVKKAVLQLLRLMRKEAS